MHKIYKYSLPRKDVISVTLPLGSTILKVDSQYDVWVMWALVNPDNSNESMKNIVIYGTGQEISNITELKYINTFFENQFVWHAFEIIEIRNH